MLASGVRRNQRTVSASSARVRVAVAISSFRSITVKPAGGPDLGAAGRRPIHADRAGGADATIPADPPLAGSAALAWKGLTKPQARPKQVIVQTDRLGPGDDAAAPVNQDGATGAVHPQRLREGGAAAVGAAIGVPRVGGEIA